MRVFHASTAAMGEWCMADQASHGAGHHRPGVIQGEVGTVTAVRLTHANIKRDRSQADQIPSSWILASTTAPSGMNT